MSALSSSDGETKRGGGGGEVAKGDGGLLEERIVLSDRVGDIFLSGESLAFWIMLRCYGAYYVCWQLNGCQTSSSL